MSDEIETTFYTADHSRVHVSEWDEGGSWVSLAVRGGSTHVVLTREETQQLIAGLQAILAKEVTA